MNIHRQLHERLKWLFTPSAQKKRLLDDALAIAQLFPDTAVLLDMAAKDGIGIRINGRLAGSRINGQFVRRIDGKSWIDLAPRATSEEVMVTLFHELRHVWQAKVMGVTPSTGRSEEGGAELGIIINRVKEADAFAFAEICLSTIAQACDDWKETMRMKKELSVAGELSPENELKIKQHFQELAQKRPSAKQELEEYFTKVLRAFSGYDRGKLERYHLLYTHPMGHRPAKHANDSVDIARLRRILRVGTSEAAPAYFDNLDDASFAETVMKDVNPRVRQALKLMDNFEAAAKTGLKGKDNLRKRLEIHRAMKVARRNDTFAAA